MRHILSRISGSIKTKTVSQSGRTPMYMQQQKVIGEVLSIDPAFRKVSIRQQGGNRMSRMKRVTVLTRISVLILIILIVWLCSAASSSYASIQSEETGTEVTEESSGKPVFDPSQSCSVYIYM